MMWYLWLLAGVSLGFLIKLVIDLLELRRLKKELVEIDASIASLEEEIKRIEVDKLALDIELDSLQDRP